MSQAYQLPPLNGMLSFAKTWLREQDITGAKSWAKKQGQMRAEETARKQQAAQDWADVTIGESMGGSGKRGIFYSPLLKRSVDVSDVMSDEEKQSALNEAQSRKLGKQADESFARAKQMRERAGSTSRGLDSDFYKNLTKGQQEGYSKLSSILDEKDIKLTNKIPTELLPKFLQQVTEMGSNPLQIKEFLTATINNGESFLDENQKFLSKEKAKGESFDREMEFQGKLDAQNNRLKEERQKMERASSAPVQSAIEQVRNEYAGMNPDQVIAHYQSKHGQPKYSEKQRLAAINKMEDETDQMAASKLGMKYSPSRGLY
jgi:hypothetical protein